MFFLLFYTFFLLTNHVSSTPSQKHIFILAGQSNMAGRGGVLNGTWDNYIPPESRSNPSIFRLNGQLQWEVSSEPTHADIDVLKTCGVGPGMAFANAVRDRLGVVGLVPCAIGGTNITQWKRGGELYMNLVKRAKVSLEEGGMISALLWYQGESDTILKEDARTYKRKMEQLVRDIRMDLEMPTLPVIQVAIASGEGPYIEKVRDAQKGINLPNVTWVDAWGLPTGADHLHLTTQAQVQLGKMLARSYLKTFQNIQTYLHIHSDPTGFNSSIFKSKPSTRSTSNGADSFGVGHLQVLILLLLSLNCILIL